MLSGQASLSRGSLLTSAESGPLRNVLSGERGAENLAKC